MIVSRRARILAPSLLLSAGIFSSASFALANTRAADATPEITVDNSALRTFDEIGRHVSRSRVVS